MKNFLIMLGFLLYSITSIGQEIPNISEYIGIYPGVKRIMVSPDKFFYTDTSGVYEYENVKYPSILEIQNTAIRVSNKIPFVYTKDSKQVLILRDRLIFIAISPILVQNLEIPFFIGVNKDADKEYELTSPYKISASSSLQEKGKIYVPDNLGLLRLEKPWSEGAPGLGIGEWLLFGLGIGERRGKPIGIYLINGYVSFASPERYTNNGRIKKMTLTSLKTGKSKQFDVLDTPNPQFFPTEDLGGYEFKLTIVDVYPGEKYEDTCVSGILSLNVSWEGPVPADFFESSPLLK